MTRKFSTLLRIVCLLCVMAMLLTSCEVLGGIIPGLAPEEPPVNDGGDAPNDSTPPEHTACTDTNSDHKCDECGKTLGECTDENDDHACDLCGARLSECLDQNRDHECDLCSATVSVCTEGEAHECELCGKTLSVCADADLDHKCDVCDATLSECLDGNPHDHKCDVCGVVSSECSDENNDHFCDICKVKLTNCEDNNSDHECELCGKTMSVCADNDRDHKCDICSVSLSSCSDITIPDHKCDLCSATLSECSYIDRVCPVCGDTTVYKHVVVIGVDGAGSFFKETSTPNMDAIFADGAITYEGITESPSISAECWASLMHGVNASVHGVTASSASSYPIDSPFPSFFRVIRENNPYAVLGSYTTWQTINNLIVEDGIGVTKVGWSGTDADLTAKICQYVKSSAPNALYIQFDNVDAAGHNYGFGSEAHLNKISETDALIGLIYDAYTERGIIDDTLFIVTTDHGGTQVPSGSYLGNHGGETAAEKQITFAADGKTVVNGGKIEGFEIRDTAAIVLYALGYEQPETWTARVPSDLFEGVDATERPTWSAPETNATPKPGEAGYVTNYVSEKELITYLTFDETTTDACGTTTTVHNTITYQEGYFGKGAALGAGYITLDDFKVGTDSFTVATFVKTSGVTGDPVLLGNKDWKDSGLNPGLILSLHDPVPGYKDNYYFIANFADGSTRIDLRPDLPTDFRDGYFHIAVIFDRDNDKLSIAFNFEIVATMDIPASLKNATAESLMPLNIGQDGKGSYSATLNATVDEFMIFDGAFTTADLSSLKNYFAQRVEEAPELEDSLTKEVLAHLTFDLTTEDSTGNYETVPTKGATYGDGYLGSAMQLNGNSVTLKDIDFGTNSVTFSTWVYITGTNGGDPVLFANKDWNSGNNAGILVCPHTNGTLIVNFSDGTSAGRVDLKPNYPTDMLGRWMHLLVVVDREAGEIRVSFDFGDFVSASLGSKNVSTPLDGAYDLVIGQDGTTSYKDNGNVYLKGYVDDFIIFSGAFDESDLKALEEYYSAQ